MSTPVRWITVTVLGIVVLAVVVALIRNVRMSSEGEPVSVVHVWVVQSGQTRTWEPEHVGPDDRYRCPGKGGVNGTPEPGHGVGGSGGFSISTASDGTVTANCGSGPPADH